MVEDAPVDAKWAYTWYAEDKPNKWVVYGWLSRLGKDINIGLSLHKQRREAVVSNDIVHAPLLRK